MSHKIYSGSFNLLGINHKIPIIVLIFLAIWEVTYIEFSFILVISPWARIWCSLLRCKNKSHFLNFQLEMNYFKGGFSSKENVLYNNTLFPNNETVAKHKATKLIFVRKVIAIIQTI